MQSLLSQTKTVLVPFLSDIFNTSSHYDYFPNDLSLLDFPSVSFMYSSRFSMNIHVNVD